MVGRLTKQMLKIVQADATNPRGLRNVIDGEAELLYGFEFNINAKLGATFYAPFTAAIDRVSGELTIDIPSFIPLNMLAAPSGATHYKISSAGAEIDFEAETYVSSTSETTVLPITASASTIAILENEVTAASTKPLFLALAVEFFQEVNGEMYPLKNGGHNPAALVQVSGL